MANVPNPAVASVELRGSLLGQTYINRFHVSGPVVGGVPTPVVEGGLESTLQKVRTWLLTEYLPNMPTALRINTVVGRQLIAEGGVQVELPVDQDGGEEGDVLPNNVAVCMTLTSGLTGRSGRGRVYLGGILRSWQVENNISPVIGEALRLRWESLRSNLATFAPQFSHGMVVYSTEVNGAPRTVGLATPVSSIILRDTTFDSQRRRLPGRGR